MSKKNIFDKYHKRYDAWYERNKFAYFSELKAIRKVLPKRGKGLEIGVGTGRFASALGIEYGLEPSLKMARIAGERGVKVKIGRGEKLPFKNQEFDFCLVVITISFVSEPGKVIKEIKRVLNKKGRLIIGMVDRESFLGRFYQKKKSEFYKEAHLFSPPQVVTLLKEEGFKKFLFWQTIFHLPHKIKEIEKPKTGFGEGGFVVICARI